MQQYNTYIEKNLCNDDHRYANDTMSTHTKVYRIDRLPRKFVPEYLPIIRNILPFTANSEGQFVDSSVLATMLFNSIYSESNRLDIGRTNAFHSTRPDSSGPVAAQVPMHAFERPWVQIREECMRFPKIVRFHSGWEVWYKVIGDDVRTTEDLEHTHPPPPGHKYLYIHRYGGNPEYGLDKFAISQGALDDIATRKEMVGGRHETRRLLHVFVVEDSPNTSYLAIDFRGKYDTASLDANTIRRHSVTSRSGAGKHIMIVPFSPPGDIETMEHEQISTYASSLVHSIVASKEDADGMDVQVGRTLCRRARVHDPSHPVSHMIHVETLNKAVWDTRQPKISKDFNRTVHGATDDMRREVMLLLNNRRVSQLELEVSLKMFFKKLNRGTRLQIFVDDLGFVSIDVHWHTLSMWPNIDANSLAFWGPSAFSVASQQVLAEFEKFIEVKVLNRPDIDPDLSLAIPTFLENKTVFTHVPPPLCSATYHAATAAVRAMQFLYPFQIQTVCEMVARETAQDGIMGMYNTRMTGRGGDEGVFACHYPFDYIKSDPMYVHCPASSTEFLRMCGGILGDETGMGKTRQIIALIKALPRRGASLVVVKPALMLQWQEEIKSVWPDCRVVQYHGTNKKNVVLREAVRDANIVLTTYTTFASNCEDFGMGTIDWGRLVTDESHDMSERFVALQAGFIGPRWALTATPHKRLRRIMAWLCGKATNTISGTRRFYWEYFGWKLHGSAVLRPVLLRKTRAMYLDLPPVVERTVTVTLDEDEASTYEKIITNQGQMSTIDNFGIMMLMETLTTLCSFGLFKTNSIKGIDRRREDERTDASFVDVDQLPPPPENDVCSICIDVFTDPARTNCNHWFCTECLQLALTRSNVARCPMCRAPIERRSVSKRARDQSALSNLTFTETGKPSSKIAAMLSDIRKILQTPGRKIIVFFPSPYTIRWFKTILHDEMGVDALEAHGGISLQKRRKNFSDFQTSHQHRVLLASVKCVSDGISLTAASDIMMLTPTGTNAVDEQIVGRANRIGRDETVPVTLWRYITACTVEDQVYAQQKQWGHIKFLRDIL